MVGPLAVPDTTAEFENLNNIAGLPSPGEGGGGGGASTFLQLRDTPSSYEDGSYVRSGSAGLYFSEAPSTPSGPVTGGLTRADVLALISNWAEQGNTDLIPVAKIPTLTDEKVPSEITRDDEVEDFALVADNTRAPKTKLPADTTYDADVSNWAFADNTDAIPASKLS